MGKPSRASPTPKQPADRIPAAQAPAEAVERIVPRRQLRLEQGDVVIIRERLPRLIRISGQTPKWRFRVYVHPMPTHGAPTFTSFAAAAGQAEQMANERRSRLMFVEDDIPSLLANYRR